MARTLIDSMAALAIQPAPTSTTLPSATKKKPQSKTLSYRMYPHLHPKVQDLLSNHNLSYTFHLTDTDQGSAKSYDTNISGTFKCYNPACSSKFWTSGRIAITIRAYGNNKYNARVYNQRCGGCRRICKAKLDEDVYAERVAYRLKKWSGVEVELPPFKEKKTAPHVESLCEGCKAGHCSQ